MSQSFSNSTNANRLFGLAAVAVLIAGSCVGGSAVSADPGARPAPEKVFANGVSSKGSASDSKETTGESASDDQPSRIERLLNTRKSIAATFAERLWTNARDFEASAYCLRGRTASGQLTRPGILAADPRVLPIGTVVHLQAGEYSGIYTVLDTGGLVKGKRVDIYCASYAEAIRFGRRTVRVRVIAPAKSSRRAGRGIEPETR